MTTREALSDHQILPLVFFVWQEDAWHRIHFDDHNLAFRSNSDVDITPGSSTRAGCFKSLQRCGLQCVKQMRVGCALHYLNPSLIVKLDVRGKVYIVVVLFGLGVAIPGWIH